MHTDENNRLKMEPELTDVRRSSILSESAWNGEKTDEKLQTLHKTAFPAAFAESSMQFSWITRHFYKECWKHVGDIIVFFFLDGQQTTRISRMSRLGVSYLRGVPTQTITTTGKSPLFSISLLPLSLFLRLYFDSSPAGTGQPTGIQHDRVRAPFHLESDGTNLLAKRFPAAWRFPPFLSASLRFPPRARCRERTPPTTTRHATKERNERKERHHTYTPPRHKITHEQKNPLTQREKKNATKKFAVRQCLHSTHDNIHIYFGKQNKICSGFFHRVSVVSSLPVPLESLKFLHNFLPVSARFSFHAFPQFRHLSFLPAEHQPFFGRPRDTQRLHTFLMTLPVKFLVTLLAFSDLFRTTTTCPPAFSANRTSSLVPPQPDNSYQKFKSTGFKDDTETANGSRSLSVRV